MMEEKNAILKFVDNYITTMDIEWYEKQDLSLNLLDIIYACLRRINKVILGLEITDEILELIGDLTRNITELNGKTAEQLKSNEKAKEVYEELKEKRIEYEGGLDKI